MGNDIVYRLAHTEIAGLQWLPQKTSELKVLSLHGWLDNAASFSNLSPYLMDYTHIAVDHAGHGLSKHRPIGSFYHLWDYVLDVVSILNQSSQPCWLIGHSMGGSVAMLVAAIVPDKVRGLIVLDSMGPVVSSPADRVVTLQRAVQKMVKHRPDHNTKYQTQDDMVLARMNGFTSLSKSAAKLLVERGSKQTSEGDWTWRHDGKLSFPSPYRMDEASVEAFLQGIKCPSLVLMAKEGIYTEGDDIVSSRAAQFSWLKLKWLEGNHHFHLEPDTVSAVAAEVQYFIDQN
ncbi:alpha/beta fold hydrolase [Marinomonas transparens]|uniref:Alpha/beta hydrolase n=1 Tax=Marinomonas transparens TaxID=2795388 RepID=A0A934MXM0_9GAMM|nr:alpha/beta hydrolase [Marinomonas transparens]MBJ7539469.1 alpha/beta hydrolase [Marinomonas transparens]